MSLLEIMLDLAVPMWIRQLQHLTPEQRMARARECATVVAEKGDVILYRSSKKGDTANAFNHLAEGIALATYQPGGVTVFGRHWCVNHDECITAEKQTNTESEPNS